ncbi:MAG: type 4a pilus biogenesis protein PilO [Patescibacteria group bacterium]
MNKGVIGILFLVGAIAIFVALTSPKIDEIKELRTEKLSFDKALEDSRELQELRDSLLAKFNSIPANDLAALSKMVPENSDTTKLMVEISSVANSTGVVIRQIGFAEETASNSMIASRYRVLNIDITFSSSYDGLRAFMEELQKSLRLIDIEQIDFISNATGLYEFSITAKAYFKT